jgi:hypothetical protein
VTHPGKVPEWLNGTVSKTVVGLVSTEGSNPSLPANETAKLVVFSKGGDFDLFLKWIHIHLLLIDKK